jgi:hypothetical protein
MTEEQALELSFGVIPKALLRGIQRGELELITESISTMITYLYRRGYQIQSYLTGEDYEKQQKRDFPPRDFPVSGHLPCDTKENSGGN